LDTRHKSEATKVRIPPIATSDSDYAAHMSISQRQTHATSDDESAKKILVARSPAAPLCARFNQIESMHYDIIFKLNM